jgi:F-type H+-transporting ATPase subunit b
MENTLHALAGLFLDALPTFLLIIVLHFYLKAMFFRPMGRVLEERRQATEGARKLAEESLAKASEKAAEHEAAIRAARAEIYREQEAARQQWRQEHATAIHQARLGAEGMVKESKQQLAGELIAARQSLAAEADALAGRIVERVLGRRAA